jgi:hypothetical protein
VIGIEGKGEDEFVVENRGKKGKKKGKKRREKRVSPIFHVF